MGVNYHLTCLANRIEDTKSDVLRQLLSEFRYMWGLEPKNQ